MRYYLTMEHLMVVMLCFARNGCYCHVLWHEGMTNTQNSETGRGGCSCHQAKWTVNIFTVRVISSLDLFQQGLPEGSIHWPPYERANAHSKAKPSPLRRHLQAERSLMFSPLWEHSCADRSVSRLHMEYAEPTHLKRAIIIVYLSKYF